MRSMGTRPARGRVRLHAYTGGIGPVDANLRLARRRGEVVKAALVRRGIPADAIDIIAWREPLGSSNGRHIF